MGLQLKNELVSPHPYFYWRIVISIVKCNLLTNQKKIESGFIEILLP